MLDRVTERRGLYDIDGNILSNHVICAAWYGSPIDGDVCHIAVRDMVSNICRLSIVHMVREFDLERNMWFTDIYGECGRYADDILCDWRACGSPTYESLYDTTAAYIHAINSCPKPSRRFQESDFVHVRNRGTVPNTLSMPGRPEPYIIGEGHGTATDGVNHPLMAHMVDCVPPGLLPHNASGCKHHVEHPIRWTTYTIPNRVTHQLDKEESIRDMVKILCPDAAYMLERSGRHDVLLLGVDRLKAISLANSIRDRYGTPVGCIALQSDTLLRDEQCNDAKYIISRGIPLSSDINIPTCNVPRPAGITNSQIVWNLDRLGFPICAFTSPVNEQVIRPEYIITASHFHGEPRWYLSATGLLLQRKEIDWDLMVYLAKTYGFAGLLYDILNALERLEGDVVYGDAMRILGKTGQVLNTMDIEEVLRFTHA